jgi:hypothetical protein
MNSQNIIPVANPEALGNVNHGELVFKSGVTDPIKVYKAHLWWARGAAAEYHFVNGYRAAAERAGVPVGASLDLFGWNADKDLIRELWARRLDYPCPYDGAAIAKAEGKV